MTMIHDFDRFDTLCRICLKREGPMSSIFSSDDEKNDDKSSLATRITSIAQIEMSPDDGLPVSICQTCHQQVNKFYDFRLLVAISNNALRSYLDGFKKREGLIFDDSSCAKETNNQAYFVDNNAEDDSKELLIVNTVIVPPKIGSQTQRVGNAKEEESKTEEKKTYLSVKHDTLQACDYEKNKQIYKRNGSQKSEPIVLIKNSKNDRSFFSLKLNEKISDNREQAAWVTSVDENDDQNIITVCLNDYNCQLCTKPFKSLRTLKRHVRNHCLSGKGRTRLGGTSERRFEGTRTRTGEIETSCSSEGKNTNSAIRRVFRTSDEPVGARETSEGFNEPEVAPGIVNDTSENCKDCGGEAETSKLHRDQATSNDLSLTCLKCNKHFRTAQTYRTHGKRHTLGSRFRCAECGKSYYTNSELTRHAQLHTGTRRYPCHLCEMSFFSKPELNRHIKYHYGEKKFRCEVCSKTYYESGHLKVHERVHTGEKPFSCNVCDKAFVTRSKLVRHFKIHEKKSNYPNVDYR